jgi:hypothetical protein
MREREASLQQFGEFLLRGRLVKERAAPHCVRWVRRFLARPAGRQRGGGFLLARDWFYQPPPRGERRSSSSTSGRPAAGIFWRGFSSRSRGVTRSP